MLQHASNWAIGFIMVAQQRADSVFGRFTAGSSTPRNDDNAGAPSLRAFERAARPFFLSDSMGVVVDANLAARALGDTLNVRFGHGSRVRALFGDNQAADSQIYRALKRVMKDGAGVEIFAIEHSPEIEEIHAEISDCGQGEYFLWCLDTSGKPAPAKQSDPIQLPLNLLQLGALHFDEAGEIVEATEPFQRWIGEQQEAGGSDTARGAGNLKALFGAETHNKLTAAFSPNDEFTAHDVALERADAAPQRGVLFRQSHPSKEGHGVAYLLPNSQQPAESVSDVRRLVRLLDDAPVAVAVTDLDGLVLEANDGLAMFSGGAARVGAAISLAVRLEDREDVYSRINAVASGKSFGSPLDVKLTGEAGNEHAAHAYAHRIHSDEGDLIFVYLVDVSERKAVELQLAQAQKLQAVGKLAGGIAHDVNNVLTAIRGHCDLLMLRHASHEPGFEHLTQIRAQTERAADVIRQLLAFSRQQTMRRSVVDITELLDQTGSMLNPLVTERVQVKRSHSPNLSKVRIDKNEFQRVLLNLAVNACDAMPNGGTLSLRTRNLPHAESLSIDEQAFVPGDYILIEISDTGSGISARDLPNIFEPFFTTKGTGKGTGLGLSTAYGIIKQMGGFIYCDSVEGAGTTFSIYLPHYKGDPDETEAASAVDETKPIDLSGRGCILLVEDEEAVRSFAVKALELRGYSVKSASNGADAIELVEDDPNEIDLIVSDVVMPEMTGPEMMREVRKKRPEIQFVFVSGYAEEAFREEMVEDEEFEFLAKPFSLKDLAVKVKEVMERGKAA